MKKENPKIVIVVFLLSKIGILISAGWKAFIKGTASLAYVNYHQQDENLQIYNGNTAVVTAYYTFTWMEKGGKMEYQSGRASTVLVK